MGKWHHINRLPSGSWRVRVISGGKQIQSTFPANPGSSKPPAAAIQFRDTVLLDTKLRKHGLPGLMRPRPNLSAIIKEFLSAQEERVRAGDLSDRTFQAYWERTRGILGWLAETDPTLRAEDLDDRRLAKYITCRLGRRLSTKSTRTPTKVMVSKEIKLLRRIYRDASVEQQWKTPRLPTSHGGKRILEINQLWTLLDAMPEGSLERTFCEVGICTGLRPKNIRELTLDEIDWKERLVTTTAVKTGRSLVLPFDDHLEWHLKAWISNRVAATHRLLFHLNGRALTSSTLRRRLTAASKAAGLDPPVEYAGLLRNSFIAYLRAQGVSWDDLAQYVDHSDVRTTQGYAKRFIPMEALRRVAGEVEAMRSSGPHRD